MLARAVEGVAPKDLRGLVDQGKKQVGSGVVAIIGVSDGKAGLVVGVTDDLTDRISAVDLARARLGGARRQGRRRAAGPRAGRRPGRRQGGSGAEGDRGRGRRGRGVTISFARKPPSTSSVTPFTIADPLAEQDRGSRRRPPPAAAKRPSGMRFSMPSAFAGSLHAFTAIGVSVTVGLTELTRMPCGPSSTAITRVIASSAPFEAQ